MPIDFIYNMMNIYGGVESKPPEPGAVKTTSKANKTILVGILKISSSDNQTISNFYSQFHKIGHYAD